MTATSVNDMTELKTLIEKYKTYVPEGDTALLEKAYNYAAAHHSTQKRASGEPYFIHCVAVADTLLSYKLDLPTVCAALLHDVIEDTGVTEKEFETEFGSEITRLVQGVTKIEHLTFSSNDEETAENWRKMLMATASDIRVILIKLADRLHNMNTLEHLPREKQIEKATETLSLYAPLAQRLGMFGLKSELEDLSFKMLEPDQFNDLATKLEGGRVKRQQALDRFKADLEMRLGAMAIPHRVLARAKNIYSFYRKMRMQNRPFEEIQDSLGVRILTDTVANCYALLGFIHSVYKPVAGSFTDYIAIPKMNLYQSLHTTVVSPTGDIVEIQIRTEDMHRTSEYGIAAHWRYKLGGRKDPHFDEKLNWLRQWLEWLQDLTSPREFLESLRTDMELHQVFVFTPRGDVKVLPHGATPLDFAYAVHSDVGNSCFGAKVNGKMVGLDYELKNGEFCEILTRKNITPKPAWIKIVHTANARSKIRHYLREHGMQEEI